MIKGTIIKDLREQYGLTQEELAKAIFVDKSAISKYECGDRIPPLDKYESIVNVFGYSLELTLKEKQKARIDSSFYRFKTPLEVIRMSNVDIVEYIFVKGNNELIGKICNIPQSVLERLPLEQQKAVLSDAIEIKSKRVLYHILNNTYGLNDELIVLFTEAIRDYLDGTTIKRNDLDKAYYLQAECEYYEDDKYWGLKNLKLLDNYKNDLGVCGSDITNGEGLIEEFLADYLNAGLGRWFAANKNLYIKEF